MLAVPERPRLAPLGSELYERITDMPRLEREQVVINEVLRGNIPDFLKELKPITVSATISGEVVSTTIYVTPDYLAVGNDKDSFRIPMGAPLAQQLADELGCSLPTRKIVNDIHTNATVKLAPSPFSPDTYDIDSVEVFWLSHQAIEEQRAGQALGSIVSGIKKDVVITAQIPNRPPPPRVAIYGWHQLNGQPIQPLSLVHVNYYHDYSHGTRLVLDEVIIKGETFTVAEVLAHPQYHVLLSDEGAFNSSRYPIETPLAVPSESRQSSVMMH